VQVGEGGSYEKEEEGGGGRQGNVQKAEKRKGVSFARKKRKVGEETGFGFSVREKLFREVREGERGDSKPTVDRIQGREEDGPL